MKVPSVDSPFHTTDRVKSWLVNQHCVESQCYGGHPMNERPTTDVMVRSVAGFHVLVPVGTVTCMPVCSKQWKPRRQYRKAFCGNLLSEIVRFETEFYAKTTESGHYRCSISPSSPNPDPVSLLYIPQGLVQTSADYQTNTLMLNCLLVATPVNTYLFDNGSSEQIMFAVHSVTTRGATHTLLSVVGTIHSYISFV